MDPLEIDIGQNLFRDFLLSFDGRVPEVFSGSGSRFHVRQLTVFVGGPDKRGNRNMTLKSPG